MTLFSVHNLKKFATTAVGTAAFIFLSLNMSFAQTSDKIGDNPGNKHTSAVLELESTTKGFLLPRMSPSQMAAISNPALGLQIYNTTDSCIYVYRGISGWYSTCGGFNAWSTFGNTGINPSTNFLGTTDGQPLVVKTNGVERLRFDAAGNINQTGSGAVNFTGYVTANAGATITGPSAGAGFVNINTVGANTTNIGTSAATTNLNGANLFIPALPTGSTTTDALIGVNRTTGKVDTLNIANLVSTGITANNGLTKTNANIQLGGALVSPTTITTTAANTLGIAGLLSGTLNDSLVSVDPATGNLRNLSIANVVSNSFTANNGLTKAGNNVQLGGTLVQATSLAQGANAFSISGTGGATNINASGSSPTNVGNATSATTISGTTTVNATGTSATTIGNANSAVTINGTTGITGVTSINTGASTTATNIGNAAATTTINGTSLNVTSLASGALTDSLVSVNPATGKVNRLSIANVVSNSFTANNGLTKTGSNVALGGALISPTTITTTAANTLGIAGLLSGTLNDSLVSVDPATGNLRNLSIANVVSNSFTANNGLTKTGNNVQLGGTLVQATSLTQGANALSISGTGGATNINAAGTSPTNIGNATSATTVIGATTINTTGNSNTSIGNATGTITTLGATNVNTTGVAATNIGNSGSAVTIAGVTSVTGITTINTTGTSNTSIGNTTGTNTVTGNNLIVSSLPGGAITDSLVSVNNVTGAVRKLKIADVVGGAITADNGLTKSTANNVQLGGTLLKATAVAQAGFDMNFSGGNVAIGQNTSPNSTLQITGSMSVSYKVVTANRTLDNTDQIVLGDATGGAITLTLPTPSAAVAGRIYTVGKYDETINLVNFSPSVFVTKTTSVPSVNFPKKYRVVCDGTNWILFTE